MTQTGNVIWRDFQMQGVAASGAHKPAKVDIRAWATLMEDLRAGVGIGYPTQAALAADLAHDVGTLALVYADTDPAKNGMWRKNGASGSGSWVRIGDSPSNTVRLTVTGGSANAIVATASETPTMPGNKLFLMTPTQANTGPVTLNGSQVRNSLGAQLAVDTLLPGLPVLMAWQGDHYHLLISTPVDANGVLADVILAQSAAEAAAASASGDAAALGNQLRQYDTRAQAAAATIPVGVKEIRVTRHSAGSPLAYATYIPGTSSGPMAFQEAAGHWWQLDVSGEVNVAWFGAGTSGYVQSEINAAMVATGVGGTLIFPKAAYTINGWYATVNNQKWIMRSGAVFTRVNTNAASCLTVQCSGLEIDGGVFDGNGGTGSGGIDTSGNNRDFTWRNGELKNVPGWGIQMLNNLLNLESCYIHHTRYAGVFWYCTIQMDGPRISDCRIERDYSDYVSSGGIMLNNVTGAAAMLRPSVSNCSVILPSTDTYDPVGIEFGFAVGGSMVGNRVLGSRIAYSAETCSNLCMTGNTSNSVRSYAHELVNCEWSVCSGNAATGIGDMTAGHAGCVISGTSKKIVVSGNSMGFGFPQTVRDVSSNIGGAYSNVIASNA